MSDQVRVMVPHVRWFIRRDFPEVVANEIDVFGSNLAEELWDEARFLEAFRQRNTIGMVAEFGETVVAHMVYELRKKSLTLVKFAVNPKYRLRGVGRTMLRKLVGKLSLTRRDKIVINVPERNDGAHIFLKKQGFWATDVLRGECPDGSDAYRFCYLYTE